MLSAVEAAQIVQCGRRLNLVVLLLLLPVRLLWLLLLFWLPFFRRLVLWL